MLKGLKNIIQEFSTPLRSAGVVLLFFTALIMLLWVIMFMIRLIIG